MPLEPGPPVSEALYASAVRFAGSSLQAFAAEDDAVFLLHAGTALEHLTKSLLASLHGSLIASSNPKQFGSLLFLAGFEKESGLRRSQMRTVSMEEALSRAGHLLPQLVNLRAPLQPLVDGRNSVAHAALADRSTAESTLVPFLRACELLLAAMSRNRAGFWGDMLDVVDARETESAKAATIAALEKIAAARAVFAALVGSLGDDARNGLLLTIENGYAPEKYEQTLLACPACTTHALVQGTIEVEWEPDWDYADGEAYVAGAYPEVTIFPRRLECRACGLRLEGEEELAAADVPSSWKLEDVDPDDFTVAVEEGWLDL